MIYELDGRRPKIDSSCFVAPNAAVIGSATVHAGASIWFGVTVRADRETITIGARSNIQDGSVLHADPGFALHIGADVTVGHQAMLHGCTVGDGCLVGIGAVVLNGAVIGRNCLIGAKALVTRNMQVPDGAVVMGSPGRVIRILDESKRAELAANAVRYVSNGRLFRECLKAMHDG
ncbi:MAG: gamma carbonic anhydrase family protein [Gammaproteobacteria bacterium]|nr:gamma carbonic anhydrase family protein [Gammaproteobacteria bacterium]MBP6051283.1 gamma carbonic anhydrase family protein [Pseudomonadales bacterium]MBK6581629.1 gamma carbonic anhydrase family protein [Gammaproteobacteria bacterium]MBK7170480.1 gamma carbonic anhydrase family protein [Gammaproteobacteria bacterium]MBK7522390.1 gamma carbonic anhydrase family protein [Gammaproteobacteria bacterium]